VGATVGAAVGEAVGIAVGASEGAAVGTGVGTADGIADGAVAAFFRHAGCGALVDVKAWGGRQAGRRLIFPRALVPLPPLPH
jgi:hypothetical protein